MSKVDPQLLQEAINVVAKHDGNVTEAAKELDVPRKTLSGRYNKAIDLGYTPGTVLTSEDHVAFDSKNRKLSQDHRDLKRRYRALLTELSTAQDTIENINRFEHIRSVESIEPISIPKEGKPSESTAVMLFSDLHYEETVDPFTINNMNEYNPKIAERRAQKFFQNVVKLLAMCRTSSTIENGVLWLGGDLITGYIHEELLESNAMSPVESCIEVYKLLIAGIDYLLENGGFKRLIIPCSVGNHGRTTDKRRVSTNVQNSYEWMVYNFLMQHYASEDRIQFKLTKSYHNILDIYGYKLRFHHGEYVRYGGGVGGLTVPLNKAINEWNKGDRADIDCMGHYHQRICLKNAVVNGSLIGYNAFAMSIKAGFEPPQQCLFLMHPNHGKTVEIPVWLE